MDQKRKTLLAGVRAGDPAALAELAEKVKKNTGQELTAEQIMESVGRLDEAGVPLEKSVREIDAEESHVPYYSFVHPRSGNVAFECKFCAHFEEIQVSWFTTDMAGQKLEQRAMDHVRAQHPGVLPEDGQHR